MLTYDIALTILNEAKQRLGDRLPTLLDAQPQILDRTQAYSQQAFNSAWRRLQDILAGLGCSRLKRELILSAFPPNTNTDPSSQQWIDGVSAYNGSINVNGFMLPSDTVEVLEFWERQTGAANANFMETDRLFNGLPAVPKLQWNLVWEWREDRMYLPGATVATDFRIRYAAYLADLADAIATPWFLQTVPIARCADALSLLICAEVAASKDTDAAAAFLTAGAAATKAIFDRDPAQARSILKGSEYGKMSDARTPGGNA